MVKLIITKKASIIDLLHELKGEIVDHNLPMEQTLLVGVFQLSKTTHQKRYKNKNV